MSKSSIVNKVIEFLSAKSGAVSLKEIYERLPEHPESSIRGNINRYLKENPDPKFERVGKGLYSVIEIINITDTEEGKLVDYAVSYYTEDKEMHFYHQAHDLSDNITDNITSGLYLHTDEFDSFEDMEEHTSSLRGIFHKGDAIEIMKRYKDESFELLVTDPPYRVIKGGNKCKDAPKGMLSKNDGKIFSYNDVKAADWLKEAYRLLKPNSHAYVFTNFLNLQDMMQEMQNAGFKLHNLLVWMKNNATPNRWYMKNCEYVILGRKGKAKSIKDCGSMTVHQYNNIIGNKMHETEKPIELLKSYISNSSEPNGWVLDPFAGSGSTAHAALELGRRFMTIEIDEKYAERIHDRLKEALSVS